MPSSSSRFDPLVQRLIDVLESNLSALPLRISDAPDQIDLRSIKVMISSPIGSLRAEREGLYQEVRRMPEVEPLMFEKNFDMGVPNIDESLKLVDDADLFFALFDPANPGTTISVDGPHKDKTYSQIEFEQASRRQKETGWPKIFIFLKSDPQDRVLAPWQQQALGSYAATPIISSQESVAASERAIERGFSTTKALLDTALATLNAHIIKIRGARAKYLWHRVEELQAKLDVREQELATSEDSHEKLIASMQRAHERSVDVVNETNEASSKHQQQQIERLQERLDRHHAKTARMITLGAIVGVTSIVAALLSLSRVIPKFDGTALLRSIEAAGDSVASSVGSRSLFAASMEHDPILQARKISWAEKVVTGFECSGQQREFTVSDVAGSIPLKLIRDNVCAAYAPLRLEIVVAGAEPCDYDTALKPDDWKRLQKSIEEHQLRVTHVSVVGHASRELINGACGKPLPQGLREEGKRIAGQAISIPQDRIRTNRELAYLRAWTVAEVIGPVIAKSSDGNGDPLRVHVDQLGVLDARGEARADRKVTIGISIARAPQKSPS
jgi:Domain of unknown function (DUF4062)